jgi:membrane-associated protease RseP (regulator of RpoE activity)
MLADTTHEERLHLLIREVFDINEITWGDAKQDYAVRYRGGLRMDSIAAYTRLAQNLRPLGYTPLFRIEDGKQTILLKKGIIEVRPSRVWINLVLFVLTVASVLITGALNNYDGPNNGTELQVIQYILGHLERGIPFTLSLMAILLAHEFGHYLVARRNHTAVSLPYYLPFPLSLFGTMGAFIQLKEPPKNKRTLLEIGLAGPLCGLIVALPVLWYGLTLSQITTLARLTAGQGLILEGNSLLYLGMKYLAFGNLLPAPASYGATSPLFYWMRYFFTGQPIPLGGMDVQLHSIAWAGWAGLLVTALNLVPVGQLDGGHALYALFGKKASRLFPFILAMLILLGFFWAGWWIWAFLLFLLGRVNAEPLDQIAGLDPPHKFLAVLGVVIFLLVFVPVPLIVLGG